MFAVLRIAPQQKNGLFARIRRRLRPKPLSVQRRNLPDTYYMEITAPVTRKGPDWAAVRRAAGNEAGRLILPSGITAPPGSGVAEYDATAFLRRVLLNGAAAVCESAAAHGARFSVLLLDREANCPFVVPRLMRSAVTVYIVTARGEEYTRYADNIFALTGARPIVTAQDIAADCNIMLAPYGFDGLGSIAWRTATFVGDLRSGIYLSGDMTGFGGYESCVPKGYGSAKFLAAMCERAHVRPLCEVLPDSFYDGGAKISLTQLAHQICTLDMNGSSNYNSSIIDNNIN